MRVSKKVAIRKWPVSGLVEEILTLATNDVCLLVLRSLVAEVLGDEGQNHLLVALGKHETTEGRVVVDVIIGVRAAKLGALVFLVICFVFLVASSKFIQRFKICQIQLCYDTVSFAT